MAVNDEIFKNLAQYGGGTINERVYNFLGSLGFTGTISDRLGQFEEGGRKGWQGLIRAWGQWAPAQLFSQGQQGVWYEPKPIVAGQQVLYQDSAGTTPVTADGDPVGLMLDRSKGLVLGPELVTNGTFAADLSGWQVATSGTSTVTWESGRAFVNSPDGDTAQIYASLGFTNDQTYAIEFDAEVVSGGGRVFLGSGSSSAPLSIYDFTQSGQYRIYLRKDPLLDYVAFSRLSGGGSIYYDNISIRELSGNHATQSTSAARPIYRTDGVLHWLEFDGVDDRLFAASNAVSGVVALFAVAATHGGGGRLVSQGTQSSADDGNFLLSPSSTSNMRSLVSQNGSYVSETLIHNFAGQPYVAAGELIDGLLRTWANKDSSQGAAVEVGISPANRLVIGADDEPGATYFTGDWYGSVCVSESYGDATIEYLANLAGVTL